MNEIKLLTQITLTSIGMAYLFTYIGVVFYSAMESIDKPNEDFLWILIKASLAWLLVIVVVVTIFMVTHFMFGKIEFLPSGGIRMS